MLFMHVLLSYEHISSTIALSDQDKDRYRSFKYSLISFDAISTLVILYERNHGDVIMTDTGIRFSVQFGIGEIICKQLSSSALLIA